MNIQIDVSMERNVLMEDVWLILEHVQETPIVNLVNFVILEYVKTNHIHVINIIIDVQTEWNVLMEFVFLILDVFLNVDLDKFVLPELVLFHAITMDNVNQG